MAQGKRDKSDARASRRRPTIRLPRDAAGHVVAKPPTVELSSELVADEGRISRTSERPVANTLPPGKPRSASRRAAVWAFALVAFGALGLAFRQAGDSLATAPAARTEPRPPLAPAEPAPVRTSDPKPAATPDLNELNALANDSREPALAASEIATASGGVEPARRLAPRASRSAQLSAATSPDESKTVAKATRTVGLEPASEPEQVNDTKLAATERAAEVAPAEVAPAEVAPVVTVFDANTASTALDASAGKASSCRGDSDPSGVARAVVTFAPSGRVTAAVISGPPFAGTETGSCIARTLRETSIAPFDGELRTVAKTVTIH